MDSNFTDPRFFHSSSTGALLRRAGGVDEAFVRGAWQPTGTIQDYMVGKDDNVEEIAEEQAIALQPAAFAGTPLKAYKFSAADDVAFAQMFEDVSYINPSTIDLTEPADADDDEDYCDSGSLADVTDALSGLYDELLNLVPAELHHEFGEVFYSGRTAFEQPSPIYLLGFNPGGDPANAALNRYTIGTDIGAARAPERRDWSGFEDEWGEFGPGAVAFQRRVRYLIGECRHSPRQVPASNLIFVRSTRVETLDAKRTKTLLHDCWAVHEKAIWTLGVRVVVCFGQAAGRWVRAQLGANTEPAIESFEEDNGRHWRSTTHCGRDGIQVVTLTHPSVADWTNPVSDPTGLVTNALARAEGLFACSGE